MSYVTHWMQNSQDIPLSVSVLMCFCLNLMDHWIPKDGANSFCAVVTHQSTPTCSHVTNYIPPQTTVTAINSAIIQYKYYCKNTKQCRGNLKQNWRAAMMVLCTWYSSDHSPVGNIVSLGAPKQNFNFLSFYLPAHHNLGFIFDEHISFLDQISALSKSCYSHIRQLRCIASDHISITKLPVPLPPPSCTPSLTTATHSTTTFQILNWTVFSISRILLHVPSSGCQNLLISTLLSNCDFLLVISDSINHYLVINVKKLPFYNDV